MRKFDPKLFKELAFLPENGLMDRKSQLYRVYGRNSLRSRADFTKDIIALANTARRRGKPAYLFFGVRDKPFSEPGDSLPGIDGQCSRSSKPQDWKTLTVEEQQERVGRDYQMIVRDYITQHLTFEYLWGYVDNKLVSYILIEYNRHPHPFEVTKRIASKGKVYLKKGECWQRIGESNEPVPPHEKQYLYRYDDTPYIAKDVWKIHVERCIHTYQLDLDPEIPLGVSPVSTSGSERIDWKEKISQWTSSQAHRIVLLTGAPGTGKTTTLRQTMHWLSSNLLANLEAIDTEDQPSEPIPVYVDLNERSFYSREGFKRELVSRLDEFGYLELREHPNPYTVFERGKQQFILLLDGIDEIESTNAGQTKATIRGVIENSSFSMWFLVAGRTIGMPRAWLRRYSAFKIESVEQSRVREFLTGTLDVSSEAWGFLIQDEELLQLVSSPLAMNAFKEQWEQWEKDQQDYQQQRIEGEDAIRPDPPTVAGVIQTILTKLLHHDLEKGVIEDESTLYERLTHLGKLALWLKIRNQETTSVDQAKEILGEAIYGYGRQLNLLGAQDGEVCFESTLLFDYFAVYRLKELLERSTGSPPMTWGRCGRMLDTLIADLLPILIDGYVRSQPDIAESAIV